MALSYEILPDPKVPRETRTGLLTGIFGHLGSPFTYVILLAIFGVTVFNALALFLGVSVVFITYTLIMEKRHPAVELPQPTQREIFDGFFMVFIKGVLVGGGFITVGWYLLSYIPLYGTHYNNWWLIIAATLADDLAYYWIHRLMSHSRGNNRILKYYRKKHAAHHSVTELDFLRGNQSSLVDTAISQFQPSMIIISYVLGMDLAPTLVAYGLILMLQATDHTNITFYIGPLNYIFIDNHAHKFHHCKRGNLVNHAAAFAMWDRLWGTYYENWNIAPNYLHHYGIPIPIRRKESAKAQSLPEPEAA